MRPEVVRHRDAEALAAAVAGAIAELVASAIAARGRCSLVLAGGSTPKGVYRRLAEMDLDWGRVSLLFGDERAVPPDDASSNYRMAKESLLDRIETTGVTVLRMAGELEPARAAAAVYAEVIAPFDRFDVVLLGMGDDGHVASIFPGSGPDSGVAHDDGGGAPVIATRAPVAPHDRISMTLATLGRSRSLMMLVSGLAKAARLAQVWRQIDEGERGAARADHLPAARVARELRPDARLVWHVDEAAGSALDRMNPAASEVRT